MNSLTIVFFLLLSEMAAAEEGITRIVPPSELVQKLLISSGVVKSADQAQQIGDKLEHGADHLAAIPELCEINRYAAQSEICRKWFEKRATTPTTTTSATLPPSTSASVHENLKNPSISHSSRFYQFLLFCKRHRHHSYCTKRTAHRLFLQMIGQTEDNDIDDYDFDEDILEAEDDHSEQSDDSSTAEVGSSESRSWVLWKAFRDMIFYNLPTKLFPAMRNQFARYWSDSGAGDAKA